MEMTDRFSFFFFQPKDKLANILLLKPSVAGSVISPLRIQKQDWESCLMDFRVVLSAD